MNDFYSKQYADFLRIQINNLKLEIDRFFKSHDITRDTPDKTANRASFAITLNKTTIGKLKSAIIHKHIQNSGALQEIVDMFIEDLETKKGPLPDVPYNTPLNPFQGQMKGRSGRFKKPFDGKIETVIGNFEKQVKKLQEELYRIEETSNLESDES